MTIARARAGVHQDGVRLESQAIKSVGIVGSRHLTYTLSDRVGRITEDLIHRRYHIATGGAMGADQFVVDRLLSRGLAKHGTIYAAWQNYPGFPVKIRKSIRQFNDQGGHILWGAASTNDASYAVKMSLLLRNKRLVDACYGLVAFIDGTSKGSIHTITHAAEKRLTMVVFPHECPLPIIRYVKWVSLRCGGCWDGGFKAVYLK